MPAARARVRRRTSGPVDDVLRDELLRAERFEELGRSLAAAPITSGRGRRDGRLAARLRGDLHALRQARTELAAAVVEQRTIPPAAEWLLDNFLVVEAEGQEVLAALPPHYRCQLPKLADGPLRGLPRVFGLARAFVAHTDSRLDLELLERFVRAHQGV